MADNPPEGFPVVTPYLLYEGLDAAIDWLVRRSDSSSLSASEARTGAVSMPSFAGVPVSS